MRLQLNNSLSKDFSTLLSGVVLAQLIPIILQPFLKRLFSPDEFGVFDLYFKVVGLLVILFTLRYEKAIVICRNRLAALAILTNIVLIAIFFAIVTTILFGFGLLYLTKLAELPDRQKIFLLLAPISAMFFAINLSLQAYFVHLKDFAYSATLKIVRRISEGIGQLITGLFSLSIGLALGDILGNIIASFFGFRKLKKFKRSRFHVIKNIGKKELKKYSDFPKYTLLSNLLNTFAISAITFQVYAKFVIDDVGFLELTQRMLTVPAAIIGTTVGQLALQRSSALFNAHQPILKLFLSFFTIGLLFAIPFYIVIKIWAGELFSVIFGQVWSISGAYAQSIILSSCLIFIISPLGQFLIGIKKIRRNAIWEYFKFIAILSLFFISFENIHEYLFAYNIILSIVYLVYFISIGYSIYLYDKSLKD